MPTNLSMRTRTDKAFRLNCNIDHLGTGEIEEDAWLINYPNPPGASNFAFTSPLNLPNRIEFEAIGSMLAMTDYPYTYTGWPIMSKRMLNTLLSVGSFPHRAYPVVMLNVEATYNKTLKKYDAPRTENHNYLAVHLTEHLDAFDFENSVYERSTINPDVVMNIEWISLREPTAGYPPLFTVEPESTELFVSSEARVALEAANIQGIDFQYVEDGVPI